ADYFSYVGNSVQSGLLGSLAVGKVGGKLVSKPKFKTRAEGRGKGYKKHVIMVEDKAWELCFSTIRQENYYPDPEGTSLYRITDEYIDLHEVRRLSEGEDAIYDKAAVEGLTPWGRQDEKDADKR